MEDLVDWLMKGAFIVAGGGITLIFKLAYDGIKGKPPTPTPDIQAHAPGSNGNGKVTHKELLDALQKNRCGAHEHMSNGVTEMIIQQRANADVLADIRDNMKERFDKVDSDFTETFERLRGVERRVGDVEGQVGILNERTKNL